MRVLMTGPDPRGYRVDFGKLTRTFPDLRPQWNAAFGAKDLYAALKEAQVTLADFQGRKYIRFAQIKTAHCAGRAASAGAPALLDVAR